MQIQWLKDGIEDPMTNKEKKDKVMWYEREMSEEKEKKRKNRSL